MVFSPPFVAGFIAVITIRLMLYLKSFSLLMLPGGIFCLALGPGASYNPKS